MSDTCDGAIQCIFLGTERTCKTCLSTLTDAGKKNIRRNTSAVFRINDRHGQKRTIVVDVGKNFQAAALEWFPRYDLRKIDAVLITHAHADAMNGLDDLRGWTLNGNIQPFIDIYVSLATFKEVQRAFPYLVCREFASGGGDVPEFKWHIIDDKIPFEIGDTGIHITPFAVHHGRHFSRPPPIVLLPTPEDTAPPTPVSGRSTPSSTPITQTDLHLNGTDSGPVVNPYLCFGFKFANAFVYISDVSYIPEDTWSMLLQPTKDGSKYSIPVFIVDCLRLQPHTSHFGLKEAVATVRRMGAKRNYLTGFSHEVSHEEYVTILEQTGSGKADFPQDQSDNVAKALRLVEQGENFWARPAYDGLRITVSEDGDVSDDSY